MSRFDDIAKSSARGGGLLRALRRGTAAGTADGGLSRRDLMAKAGLVGGAVIGSTLIQSVSSPAFAAASTCTHPSDPGRMCGGSGGCPTCPNNGICNGPADCTSGNCVNGTCTAVSTQPIANGQPCEGSSQGERDGSCASGYCRDNGNCGLPPATVQPGNACHGATLAARDANCAPANGATCVNGICRVADGAPCTASGECKSGVCRTGAAVPTCKFTSGAACTPATANQCVSGVCGADLKCT